MPFFCPPPPLAARDLQPSGPECSQLLRPPRIYGRQDLEEGERDSGEENPVKMSESEFISNDATPPSAKSRCYLPQSAWLETAHHLHRLTLISRELALFYRQQQGEGARVFLRTKQRGGLA